MEDAFKIYIDRLRGGTVEDIDEKLSPVFIEQDDEELRFSTPVDVKGEAYLAEDELVIRLDVETVAELPCSICEAMVKVPIELKNYYHAVPLEEIKGAVYEMGSAIREELLLAAPSLAECAGGCPEREKIKPYLREGLAVQSEEETGYRPFAELNFEENSSQE